MTPRPTNLALRPFIALCLGGILLAGCRVTNPASRAESEPAVVQAARLATSTVPADPGQLQHPSASARGSDAAPSPTFARTADPTLPPTGDEASNPLRIALPTAMPAPSSAWRPPLYPVPWALTPYDHFYFARPIAADEINWPLADYRYGGVFFEDVVHTGVDIPAPLGTPVLAAGPGKVVWAGYGLFYGVENPDDPYGLAVTIRHDFGYQNQVLFTVYGHMSQVDVVRGQRVQTGDPIGLVGVTGFTTGPHLHFELRIGTNRFLTTRNPELWIAPPQGWGILAGRVMNSANRFESHQLVYAVNQDTGQLWTVRSYGKEAVNSDPYYQENLVLGDLPAGNYLLRTAFAGVLYEQEIQILPGVVNFFTFRGRFGFDRTLSPGPAPAFTPELPGE